MHLLQEVFYFRHGLRFASEKLKKYVREGDMLDIGAYIGDSAIVLSNYTDRKVYSFELSPKLTQEIYDNLNKYNYYGITMYGENITDKVVVINKGVGSNEDVIYINDVANEGGSVGAKGDIPVSITTIDKEVENLNLIPRYFKADVEGIGLEILKGAINTIRKYRPVISISIYHSYDEFFLVHEFMKQFPNYMWEFHSENSNIMSLREISAFFYPAEIEFEEYIHE